MKKNTFYKTNPRGGISLIVLVITIIVVIILAAAVIISLQNNNPINEANRARYESDIVNMQAIFTNAVAKVMAENQGTIEVNEGELNTVKSGESRAEGRVNYTVEDGTKSGIIIFNQGTNNETTYYTGKMLPLYKAGETTWYVDKEGMISLKVGKTTYGEGTQSSEGAGTVTPPIEGGTGSGISEEAYNSLVSQINEIKETVRVQNTTIQNQNDIIQSQGDRIYTLENETILNKREELISEIVEIPCASTGENNVNVDINLSKAITEYKYLEFQVDIYSNIYGNVFENTKIIAVNSLKYWDSNTANWSNESTFSIESKVCSGHTYLAVAAWFKNANTLHIGYIYTDREDFKKFRIKKIYGIK